MSRIFILKMQRNNPYSINAYHQIFGLQFLLLSKAAEFCIIYKGSFPLSSPIALSKASQIIMIVTCDSLKMLQGYIGNFDIVYGCKYSIFIMYKIKFILRFKILVINFVSLVFTGQMNTHMNDKQMKIINSCVVSSTQLMFFPNETKYSKQLY